MSALAGAQLDHVAGDRLARRNAIILAITQALAGANNTVILGTGGIVGAMLAPDKSLATAPFSIFVVGMWIGTLPVGVIGRRYGRRTAFLVGTMFGALAGLTCFTAVMIGSFLLFCTGAFSAGLYAAAHQAYRFAAADTATPAFRPKAISWVMVGGIFAGIVGPQLIILTKDSWAPYLFSVTFLAQSAVAVLSACILLLLDIPKPPPVVKGDEGRPLPEIARQPRFLVAVACGVASYALMTLVMTSAPLAMVECNHSVTDATLGLQWHVMAMYIPSFFTGHLISRFGAERIISVGLGLLIVSGAIAVAGISLWHFWLALIVLGVGWNFGFIGATNMVTECHRPTERNKVQAFNDFLVFGSLALGSFSSGAVLANFGWAAVNGLIFPVAVSAGALLVWWVVWGRPRIAV